MPNLIKKLRRASREMKRLEECFMKKMIMGITAALLVTVFGGTAAFASGQMRDSATTDLALETVWESDAEGCTYGHHVDGCNGDCKNSTSATGCHGAGHHNSGSCYSSSCYNSSCAGGYGSDHHSSHHGGWHE